MIELIFKTIACSGLFIAFYLLILQREKMFAFNRFYLLATLVLSFTIPFMELGINLTETTPQVAKIIPIEIPENGLNLTNYTAPANVDSQAITQINYSKPGFNWWISLPVIYLVVTLILLLKFISNIICLLLIARLNDRIKKHGFTIVSVNREISTFSFFNYLYVSRKEVKTGRIQPEIFRHELAHMRQKHSLDVLLVEFLKVFFWFNPFLYMYKKSIQINHEFLADAEVLNQSKDTVHYQQLLLEKISPKPQTALASPFNYLVTKKRFIMMTKKTSRIKTIALKLFSIPLLVITMLVFSEQVSAQVQSGKGVSKELFREYKKQVRKATSTVKNADGTKTKKIDTKNLDTKLLANIYNQMSDDQKMKVTPIPQDRAVVWNLSNLGTDLSGLNVEWENLGVEMENLGVLFSSPEFLDVVIPKLDNLNFDTEYYNSPEFLDYIDKIEKNAEEIEKYYNSPEWKNKIAEIEKNAERIEAYYNSPEWKKKIEEIERNAIEIEKYYNSPEFQNKIKEIEKQAEQMGKEAEKKAKEAEKRAAEI